MDSQIINNKPIPTEHRPYGAKIHAPFDCPVCDGLMYCVGMFCCCEEHEDCVYNEETDGFVFFCKPCYSSLELPLGKWKTLIKEKINNLKAKLSID